MLINNNGHCSHDTVNDTNLFSSDDDEEFLGFRRSIRIRDKAPVNYKE